MNRGTIALSGKLTIKQQRKIAWRLYQYAREHVRGDWQEPATWRRAIRRQRCGVTVFYRKGATPGEFAPVSEDPNLVGNVAYNLAYSPRIRVRALAHEYAHLMMYLWVPCSVYDASIVYSYYDDPRDTRHRIARIFENVVASS